jgi:hypothetical protein
MNKRIEELAEQCGIIGGDLYENRVVDYEKFAELVVEESIKVMIKHDYHGEWLGEKVKEHFGIER